MKTVAKHCRDCGAAINVKTHGAIFHALRAIDGGTESQRERAWNDTAASFWTNADSAAQDCGYTGGAMACGRSGGWCAPYDETNGRQYFEDDDGGARFQKFAARIEAMVRDVPRMFAENLAQVIADDAADDAETEALRVERARRAPVIVDTLRDPAAYPLRVDGSERVFHGHDNGGETWAIIRTPGDEWIAMAPPECAASLAAMLNNAASLVQALRAIVDDAHDAQNFRDADLVEMLRESVNAGALALALAAYDKENNA